jgi:hypothetical protein
MLTTSRNIGARRREGFALLITVTLLGFLVLLLVSLASLTRVETQVAANNQQLAQARQNALLALNIALGELQLSAGPDQRTTAPAVLGEGATAIMAANAADNGLGAVGAGTLYWTGVWGNKAAPEGIFTAQPKPVLLRWLISGNENGPAIDVAADGHLNAPTTAATQTYSPGQAATDASGGALTATADAHSDFKIGGKFAKLLVGPGTAGDDPAGYAVAPLVDIESAGIPGLSGSNRVGRYAWWIGDEGVKARYDLPDPYIANATPDNGTSADSIQSRLRLLAAQRNGIELMTGIGDSNYPLATTSATSVLYLGVGKAITRQSIHMVSASVQPNDLKKHYRDLTTVSNGVLADSQFGGLRRDLTFHLDARSGDTFLDGRDILPDGATPVSTFSGSRYTAAPSLLSETKANGGRGLTTLNLSPRLGPKWDQLKSFYQTAYTEPGDLEVRPAVDLNVDPVKVQASITPVILDTRLLFTLETGPRIGTSLVIVLGNPYSRPLKASQGLNLRIQHHPFRYDTNWFGEELGVICNFVGPASASPRKISSVFTRQQGNRSDSDGTLPTAPPYIGNYGDKNDATIADPKGKYMQSYYPILKFRAPEGADAPTDPDSGHPGLLDEVLFQIPPGVLSLAPGEAKAYRINESGAPASETIDGVVMKVVPLEEMSDSIPTYFTQACDSHYVSDSSLWAFQSGGYYQTCVNVTSRRGAWDMQLDFSLTLPSKPDSPLMVTATGYRAMTNSVAESENHVPLDLFSSGPWPVGAMIRKVDFGPNSASNDAIVTAAGSRNLTGSIPGIYHTYLTPATNPYPSFSRSSIMALDVTYRQGTSTETSFTDGLNSSSAVQSAWGRGETGAPVRIDTGTLILRDVPAAQTAGDTGLLSIGQLQHVDLTATDEVLGSSLQAGNAVGNSWYSFVVPRARSISDPVDNYRALRYSNFSKASEPGDSPVYDGYVPILPKTTRIRYHDISYLLNATLWDSFFLSTVRPAAGSDSAIAPAPANRRLVYLDGEVTLGEFRAADVSDLFPDPSALGTGENGRAPAAWLLNKGSFNINSTSVEAWKAVLSGLRGLVANTTATANPAATPFARTIRQTGAAQTVLPSNVVTRDDTYKGYRALTDSQIDMLAAGIVDQVRARGPFLSLSQFVNRALVPAATFGNAVGDTGIAGAVQRAIDLTDINLPLLKAAPFNQRADNDDVYPDNSVMPIGASSYTAGLGYYQGMPGWLTQADVLESLAPSLSARSDTFVIRTYGEVVDPLNSPVAPAAPVVTARVWCEAVVQRMPDYVDDAKRATLFPADAGATNQRFGRRFKIVSFRWLSPDEI